MQVTLLGMGGGAPEGATVEAWDALEDAEAVAGAGRLLAMLPDSPDQRRFDVTDPEELTTLLLREAPERACVLLSGDTGFYSGAKRLLTALTAAGAECRVLPGLSSAQILAARLGRPWQDWTLRSAHGRRCDPVAAVLAGKPAFFLTGGRDTPGSLCRILVEAGLGDLPVTVGENLGCPEERITEATAAEAAPRDFAPLSVLLAEPPELPDLPAGGLTDAYFIRSDANGRKVPMTKQEVRAAIPMLLSLRKADTVWDVGAGTGSVSVELALRAREGRVYAVERSAEALALIEANRRKLGAWNLRPVPGEAPAALSDLPAPDAVFIGGSGGRLREILEAALAKNPDARLCFSAIALETLNEALTLCDALDLDAGVTQISASRSRSAGALRLLTAQNPVFLIAARRRAEG